MGLDSWCMSKWSELRWLDTAILLCTVCVSTSWRWRYAVRGDGDMLLVEMEIAQNQKIVQMFVSPPQVLPDMGLVLRCMLWRGQGTGRAMNLRALY